MQDIEIIMEQPSRSLDLRSVLCESKTLFADVPRIVLGNRTDAHRSPELQVQVLLYDVGTIYTGLNRTTAH